MEEPESEKPPHPSVPNHPVRTPRPWRPIVQSVLGRVGKDARVKRPNLSKTAVLVVDGRALQSFIRGVLPVVLCRALQGPAVIHGALQGPTVIHGALQGPAVLYRPHPLSVEESRYQYGPYIIDDALLGYIKD